MCPFCVLNISNFKVFIITFVANPIIFFMKKLKSTFFFVITGIILITALIGCSNLDDIDENETKEFVRSYTEKMPGEFLYNMTIDNNGMFYFISGEFDKEAYEKLSPTSSYIPFKYYLSRKKEDNGNFEILAEIFEGKLCFDKNNQLWALSSNIIYKLDDRTFNKTKILDLNGKIAGSLYFITVDNDNNIWAGGLQSGLCKIDDKLNVTHYAESNSKLPTNSMTNIHIDKNNNIWIALWSTGVLKISGNQWDVFDRYNSTMSAEKIWSLVTDKNGDLWIGAGLFNETGTSLMRFDGDKWETVKPRNDKNEIVDGTVRLLQSDGKKIYIVVEHVNEFPNGAGAEFTSCDLLTFDGVNWNKIYDIPEDENVYDLVMDDYRQAVWVTTPNKGIFKIPY